MRVLIMRFSALGDIALTVPVVEELKKQNPELELYFLSRPWLKPLFQPLDINFIGVDIDQEFDGLPGLAKLSKKIRREIKPDVVIDLHNVLRTKILSLFWKAHAIPVFTIDKGRKDKKLLTQKENKVLKPLKHSTERYTETLQKAGFKMNFKPSFFKGLKYQSEKAKELIESIQKQDKPIGIAPFAQHEGKMWPMGKMLELVKQLEGKGFSIYLFGGKSEKTKLQELCIGNNVVNLAGQFDLSTELHLISHLRLMVSMDSSNMHLATLAGIPVVSIWGATHPYAGFAPLGNNQERIVQIDTNRLNCRPCSVFGNKACFRGDYACLNWINVSDVMNKIDQVMDQQLHP